MAPARGTPRAPDRTASVSSAGIRLSVAEWGDPADPPLLLAHGTGDFARSFDSFAPLLAEGGWRVVAWDQRGHGDSDRAALYSWEADVRDSVAVMESVADEPMPVIGHSKGGMLMTTLADAWPHRVSHVVNMDGFPSLLRWWVERDDEVAEARINRLAGWLNTRRRGPARRRPRSCEELVERRAVRNSRLCTDWMWHLVETGADCGPEGWTWKLDPDLDPSMSQVPRQEWGLMGTPALGMPLLIILGLVHEMPSMGQTPESLERYLPPGARVVAYEDGGHFLHVEHGGRTAGLILEFLSEVTP